MDRTPFVSHSYSTTKSKVFNLKVVPSTFCPWTDSSPSFCDRTELITRTPGRALLLSTHHIPCRLSSTPPRSGRLHRDFHPHSTKFTVKGSTKTSRGVVLPCTAPNSEIEFQRRYSSVSFPLLNPLISPSWLWWVIDWPTSFLSVLNFRHSEFPRSSDGVVLVFVPTVRLLPRPNFFPFPTWTQI